jgi:hypothetical protein
MNTNVHPADELAAIREEIKQLQDRESFLRTSLLEADEAGREGNQYRAAVILSNRESIDKAAIVAALGIDVVAPFMRSTPVKTLKTIRKTDDPSTSI